MIYRKLALQLVSVNSNENLSLSLIVKTNYYGKKTVEF